MTEEEWDDLKKCFEESKRRFAKMTPEELRRFDEMAAETRIWEDLSDENVSRFE